VDKNFKKKLDLFDDIPPSTGGVSLLDRGRLSPFDIGLEQAVLGAILLESSSQDRIIGEIHPNMFYKTEHKPICEAILMLYNEGGDIDIVTVSHKLRELNKLEEAGGVVYVSRLTNAVASTANIDSHVKILTEFFLRREIYNLSINLSGKSFLLDFDIFDLLDLASDSLYQLATANIRSDVMLIGDMVKDVYLNIRNRGDGISTEGVPSGIDSLDRKITRFTNSDLIIVAGRPGMGKTAFAISIARNVAMYMSLPVAVFSLEMSRAQLVQRLMSQESGVNLERISKSVLNDGEMSRLDAVVSNMSSAPLYIDDTPSLTILELRAKARRLVQKFGVRLIIVDYLQLMVGNNDHRSREQEISQISRGLKAIAKEVNVPIVALSQLSRSVEQRGGDKVPVLSDLRDSGAIEQDADTVIFMYRPEYYGIMDDENGNSTTGKGLAIIAKQRNGALGTAVMSFIDYMAMYTDPGNNPSYNPDYHNVDMNKFHESQHTRGKQNEFEDDE